MISDCRLSLLAKEQSRLAKLDELRQAAKNDAELRFKKEREELGMKVESRVRQAEEKRTQLMHARSQRRAALEERTTKYLVQRVAWENKYRERVHSAILQKRTAAEKRRTGLLEGEKRRAQGRFSQVQLAARTLSCQREADRSKLKEQLEDKLQSVFLFMLQSWYNCFSSSLTYIANYLCKTGKAAES